MVCYVCVLMLVVSFILGNYWVSNDCGRDWYYCSWFWLVSLVGLSIFMGILILLFGVGKNS